MVAVGSHPSPSGSGTSARSLFDGSGWCWGGGAQGQLGNGTFGQSSIPVRVVAVRFASVDAGGYFGCGLGVDGFTYCWGNNNNGELADGTTTNRSAAVRVVPPAPIT